MSRHHLDRDSESMEHHRMKQEHELEQVREQLSVNSMSYETPVSASNVSSKSICQYLFNPASYSNVGPGTVAQCIINTGAYFVDGGESVIQFSLQFPDISANENLVFAFGDSISNKDLASMSGGSCLNIFREAAFYARSGELLHRNLYCNALGASKANFEKGIGSQLQMSGAGGGSWNADSGISTTQYGGFTFPLYWATNVNTFSLPLSKFSNLFGQSAPMPPLLLGGMKITLNFESVVNSMVFFTSNAVANGVANVNPKDGTPPPQDATYQVYRIGDPIPSVGAKANLAVSDLALSVNNMQLMMSCMTCFDNSVQIINEMASSLETSGVKYSYYNTYNTHLILSNNAQTIDVMLAAGKLKDIILCFRPANLGAFVDGNFLKGSFDPMARLPIVSRDAPSALAADNQTANGLFKSGQGTVGLLGSGSIRVRIANELVNLVPVVNASQLYNQTFAALTATPGGFNSSIDYMHCQNRPQDAGVSYADWYYSRAGTIAFSLERSTNVGISGYSTNNNRVLSVELVGLNCTGPGQIVLDVFVEYLSVANLTTSNIIVDK